LEEKMKKILVLIIAVISTSHAMADGSLYYFKNITDDTFVYTRILRCGSVSGITDRRFTASDAVGPFDDTVAAREHRELAVTRAKKAGKKAALSEGVCPAQ
jgi:hypothetical protein